MNLLNRVLVIVGCLGGLVLAGMVLMFTHGITASDQFAPASWARDCLAPLTQPGAPAWGWTLGISLALLLTSLGMLLVELRPWHREPAWVTITQDGFGRVTIAGKALRALVKQEAGGVAGVIKVRPHLSEDATQALRIRCLVAVDPEAHVPQLTQEIQARVKAAVEHHVGRPVAEVRVDAETVRPGERRGGRRVH
jgi:uncharacterized alkaline shock family protein YloU